MRSQLCTFTGALCLVIFTMSFAAAVDYEKFDKYERGMFKDPTVFPIGVWLQDSDNAQAYKDIGITYYFNLWDGPTAKQIADLKAAGMGVICKLNEYAKKSLLDENVVIGWMHRDEPDLAHVYSRKFIRTKKGKEEIKRAWPEIYKELDLANKQYEGWGMGAHPINDIQKDYKRYRNIDSTRPVVLQLSKAVALDGKTQGRGSRTGKTWEYPLYIEGCDYLSFDIYPVAYEASDKLYQVADGVDALARWGRGDRPQIVAIEAGFGPTSMANKYQQRAQIWMAICRGARSIFWFTHKWAEKNDGGKLLSEKMILDDVQVGKAVKEINAELQSLAAVINAAEQNDVVAASGITLDMTVRRVDDAYYIFAVERVNTAGEATFTVKGAQNGVVEVLNEDRSIELKDGLFTDVFTAFDTNLYKITVQ